MAKRTRGSNRPGQRHSERRAPARPQPRPAIRPDEGFSEQDEALAPEVDSQVAAPVRPAESSLARQRDRNKAAESDRSAIRARNQGLLAAKAAEEYGYVVRDVRRILRVGGVMAAVLAVFFVLIDLIHVIKV